MTKLTVVLTHYRRKENTLRILDALATQTIQPIVWVWDNSPELGLTHFYIHKQVKSAINTGCSMRWWFASQAKTKFVLILDDDRLVLDDDVLADVVVAAERAYPYVVGVAGRIIPKKAPVFSVGLDDLLLSLIHI